MIFWLRLGTIIFSILVPTWLQLGPQLGPQIHQKSIQERSKIHPNLHLVVDWFWDRFLIDFWSIFDPQIDQKSIKNQSKHHPNNTTTKKQKCWNFDCFYNIILPSAMLCYLRKSIKIDPTSIREQLSNQCFNFVRKPHCHIWVSKERSIRSDCWSERLSKSTFKFS